MNKTWKVRIILGWIVVMALLLFKAGEVEAFDILQLDEVTVVYRSYESWTVDPLLTQNSYLPDRQVDKGLDLIVNVDVAKYFYWHNTVHSMTDRSALDGSGQFRMVGLEWGLGIDLQRLWKALPVSIGRYHYSKHELDTQWGLGHLPLSDAWEINIRLYKR